MAKLLFQIISAFFIVFFSCTVSFSQQFNNQQPINRADSLKQDYIFIRNILHENYPCLYRYTDSAKINYLFDSCFASINDSTKDIDLFRIIKYIFGALEDGHLYCGVSSRIGKYIDEEAKMFPLRLYFIKDKAFVLSNISGLEAGTEITSINDKKISVLRKELFKYIVSDGKIETKKYHILNNWFSFYYLIVYGEQSKFDLMYKSRTGALKSITIDALPEKDLPEIKDEYENKNLVSLSLSGDVALLTIKTFDSLALLENNIDFRRLLDTAFMAINAKKIKKLIIDLRGNGGGRDLYGSLLYSYISNKAFDYYKSLTTVTNKLPYDKFKSTVSSYNNLSPSMIEDVDGKYFRLKKNAHYNLQTIQPDKNNFKGKLWFLIDGLSFSTTTEFCAIARSNKRGKFIGEETGGGYHGSTSGAMIDTILPNTGIRCSFGLVKYEMAVNQAHFQNRGIIPDYNVIPRFVDIINKRDIQLEFALKLANQE